MTVHITRHKYFTLVKRFLFVPTHIILISDLIIGQNITEIFIGSGFTYERDTFNFLTGIVSVMDKNTNDLFAVFTDVSYHIQWIGQFTKDVFNASEYILL